MKAWVACAATIPRAGAFGEPAKRCSNAAKHGEYCGTHSRADRQLKLRRVLYEARAVANRLPGCDLLHAAISDYDA